MARVLLLVGSAALAGGLLLGGLLLFHVETARRSDAPGTEFTSQPDCPRAQLLPIAGPRVMSLAESGTIEATFMNPEITTCTLQVSLVASSALDVSPGAPQKVTLSPERPSGTARWIVTPKQSGAWDLRVQADGRFDQPYRIKVTSILGLSSYGAALASQILVILGPIATVPYWIDRWRAKRSAPAPPAAK
jgi:hypothetical protein